MKSMTSFTRAGFKLNGLEYSVEMRSVNSRFRELSIKLPSGLTELEDQIREKVYQYVTRGKIYLSVTYEIPVDCDLDLKVNKELAAKYYYALVTLKESLGLPGEVDISLMSKHVELITVTRPTKEAQEFWAHFAIELDNALRSFVEMRLKEGENLKKDIFERINLIKSMLEEIETLKDLVIQDYAAKLKERVQRLLGEVAIDEQRLITEISVIAERSDITEELVRERSHLELFSELMDSNESVGRKMDFLVQEMNREINTIGAKANNAKISHLIVDIKGEIEKIREQIQNIE